MKWAIEGAVTSYPSCPSCYDDTSCDGEGYYCYSCGLYWYADNPEGPGHLLEDDEPVCGEVPAPTVSQIDDREIAGQLHRYVHSPCLLTRGTRPSGTTTSPNGCRSPSWGPPMPSRGYQGTKREHRIAAAAAERAKRADHSYHQFDPTCADCYQDRVMAARTELAELRAAR